MSNKHQVAYNRNKKKITIDLDEKYLRDLSANKNLFLDKDLTIPLIVAGGEVQKIHFRMLQEFFEEKGVKYSYNEGMSLVHVSIQEQIQYKLEKQFNIKCFLEKRLPSISRIADIYFEYDNKKYIIEVQKSKQDRIKYINRTKDYESIGIKCVWLVVPETIDTRSKNGFINAKDINSYELFISEDKPFLKNLIKIHNGIRLVCDFNECSSSEFINYLFNPTFGFPILKKIAENDNTLDSLHETISCLEQTRATIKEDLQMIKKSSSHLEKKYSMLVKQEKEIRSTLETHNIKLYELKESEKERIRKEYIKSLKNDIDIKEILQSIQESKTSISMYEECIIKKKQQFEIWYKELDLIKKGRDIGYPGKSETKEIRDFIYNIEKNTAKWVEDNPK